mmetsp:Transcript_6911/g.13662  ORF Transcript_6911/g.13662 Transcript_6911/m.13662 type:complete len:384 (-) Transcript_6911:240-1391(-)
MISQHPLLQIGVVHATQGTQSCARIANRILDPIDHVRRPGIHPGIILVGAPQPPRNDPHLRQHLVVAAIIAQGQHRHQRPPAVPRTRVLGLHRVPRAQHFVRDDLPRRLRFDDPRGREVLRVALFVSNVRHVRRQEAIVRHRPGRIRRPPIPHNQQGVQIEGVGRIVLAGRVGVAVIPGIVSHDRLAGRDAPLASIPMKANDRRARPIHAVDGVVFARIVLARQRPVLPSVRTVRMAIHRHVRSLEDDEGVIPPEVPAVVPRMFHPSRNAVGQGPAPLDVVNVHVGVAPYAVRRGQDDVGGDEGAAAEVAEAVLEGDGVGVPGGRGFRAADDAGGEEGVEGVGELAEAGGGGGGVSIFLVVLVVDLMLISILILILILITVLR